MDWAEVNWVGLAILSGSVFLSALIGSFIGRRNKVLTALLTAVIFAGIYLGWTGYLKQQLDQYDDTAGAVEQDPADAMAPSGDGMQSQ